MGSRNQKTMQVVVRQDQTKLDDRQSPANQAFFNPDGSPFDFGSGSSAVEGGVMMFADFRRLPLGTPTASNGDGPEDYSAFLDVSPFVPPSPGTTGLLAVRNTPSRGRSLFIDPSLATNEADCHGFIYHGDPLLSAVDSSYYETAVQFVFVIGPANVSDATSGDEVTTYIGYSIADGVANGCRLEFKAFDAFDGTPSTSYTLYLVEEGVVDYETPLFDSGIMLDRDGEPGNLIAGIYWLRLFSDGRWSLWRNGTKQGEGDGLFDQRFATGMGIIGGQRNLVGDLPEPGFWIPMDGYGVTQDGVPVYSIGAAPLPDEANSISQEGWDLFGNLAGSPVTDLQSLATFLNDMKQFTYPNITQTPDNPGAVYSLGSEGYAACYSLIMEEDLTINLPLLSGFNEYVVKVSGAYNVSWGGSSVIWRGTAGPSTPPAYVDASVYRFTCAAGYLFGELLGSDL